MNMSKNPLLAILQQHVTIQPQAPFITHLDSKTTYTYSQIFETAEKIALLFKEYKLRKGGRVAFQVRNHWLVYPLLLACSQCQAVLVPIDPELHRDEKTSIVENATPALIIGCDKGLLNYSNRVSVLSLSEFQSRLQMIASPSNYEQRGEKNDAVLMIYTSGTTGTNKCVTLTNENLVANALALAKRYNIISTDRFFCIMPTHHMNALMITGLLPIVAGAHIFLSDILSVKNAKNFWKNIHDYEITVCSLVPSIMALFLKLFPQGADAVIDKLRFSFCGAAPLPAHLWQQFEKTFNIPVYQGYGLTETTCWAVSIPMQNPRRWDSVGIPLDGCKVKIDNSNLSDIDSFLFKKNNLNSLTDGSETNEVKHPIVGEVLIKGPIVMPGYYKNPKLNKELFTKEGYFRTGDLGFIDTDGFLQINGRLKEIIIKNGTNIFSGDIDKVLSDHPSIQVSKTIGIPDELVGERIYSICVLHENYKVTEAEIRTWVNDRLSPHMYPDAIVFMGYLPAGAAGKISTGILRKIIMGELREDILDSLNSWKYKRSQPSSIDNIRDIIQQALITGSPISVLSYWGCGTRDYLSEYDRMALDRLADYVKGIKRVAQAAPCVTLIFTDMHARNNRIPQDRMDRYFAAIREYADDLCMKTILLSEIWADHNLDTQKVVETLQTPEFTERWHAEPLRQRLLEQAAKHVEQDFSPDLAAQFYYQACATESVAIAKVYPNSLFVTYNHPDFDCLSPALPKLYLYSYKQGTSVKPWFID